jgi:uncharacterized protein (UPF0335 family)
LSEEIETVEGTRAGLPAPDLLRAFVLRLERLADEIKDLQADRREVMKEAEHAGFDGKALREILRRRKLDPQLLEQLDAMVACYEEALAPIGRGQVWGGELKPQAALPPPKSDRRGTAAFAALAFAEAVERAEQR